MKRVVLFGLLLSLGVSCGGDDDAEVVDVSDRVTITQGVFGQRFCTSDVDGEPDTYGSDTTVGAFDAPPESTTIPLESNVSDEVGFFEIELPSGTYQLCSLEDQANQPIWYGCAETQVSGLVRCDYYGCGDQRWHCKPQN